MADLNALRSLAERLEKATGPDRELDADIFDLFDPLDQKRMPFTEGSYNASRTPHVTASIDAALALVERMFPGWECVVSTVGGARIFMPVTGISWGVRSSTPALSILRALVAALIAKEEGHA